MILEGHNIRSLTHYQFFIQVFVLVVPDEDDVADKDNEVVKGEESQTDGMIE